MVNASSPSTDATDILRTVALTAFAGGTTFIGIYLSKRINFSQRHIRALTSLGAGVLISAAVFQMIMEAEHKVGLAVTFFAFIGGAILFTVLDIIAEKKSGGGTGILLGIGLDSIPESIAIGASVASGPVVLYLF